MLGKKTDSEDLKKHKCPRCGYSTSGKQRSNQQSRYYWGCVIQTLSDETGFTKDEMHDIIKHKFLTESHVYKSKNSKVEEMKISKSTTQLTTKDFEELMSNIRIWASKNLSIFIPEPNEEIKEN